MKKRKICGIYMIKNKINGKIYIGQSVNINQRKSRHKSDLNKNKHGNSHLQNSWNKYEEKNFEFTIIEECNVDMLNNKEIYWINYYDSCNNSNGYNEKTGGNNNFVLSDNYINKMREAQFKIPILQINLNGIIVKEWSGAREASKTLNISQSCIWQCVNNNRKTYKNFIWIKKEKYKINNFNINDYINQNTQPIKIVQLNLYGNLIKIWNSSSEAHIIGHFDSSSIIKCCKHKSKSHKRYMWLYYEEYKSKKKKIKYKTIQNKEILQLDLNNNLIKVWDSIVQAEKYFANKRTGNIGKVLGKKNKTAYGFKWEYKN